MKRRTHNRSYYLKLVPLVLLAYFTLNGCSDCDDSIEVNNPPFPCMSQLGLRSYDDLPEGSNECESTLVLRGRNNCDEDLIFPGSFGGTIYAPNEEIAFPLSPFDFEVEGPHRRNHEIPITKGNQTLVYKFSMN